MTEYVVRITRERSAPTVQGSTVIATHYRGESVAGYWTTGPDGTTLWLRVANNLGAVGYIWSANLSNSARPTLQSFVNRDSQIVSATDIRSEPNTTAKVLDRASPGLTEMVVGFTADGWAEIALRSGGVGYVPKSALSSGGAEDILSAAGFHYIVGLDPNGDNWLALRSDPSLSTGSRLAKLGPDTLFSVLGRQGDWLHVQLQSGEIGWIDSRYVACCKQHG